MTKLKPSTIQHQADEVAGVSYHTEVMQACNLLVAIRLQLEGLLIPIGDGLAISKVRN